MTTKRSYLLRRCCEPENRRRFVARLSAKKTLSGFTLLETLIAIAILMVAIAGPLTIAAMGLNSSLLSSDQITATYLAQGALEYIREVRDTNTLDSQPWLTNLEACISANGSKECYVDTTSDPQHGVAQACSGGVCLPIRYNDSGDSTLNPPCLAYSYSNNPSCGEPTVFTRTVSITCAGGGDCTSDHEASTTATVSWADSEGPHHVTLHEILFRKWQSTP